MRYKSIVLNLDIDGMVEPVVKLGVDLSLTHSCYDPSPEGLACGACDSCLLRLKGFREAGTKDPIPYAQK